MRETNSRRVGKIHLAPSVRDRAGVLEGLGSRIATFHGLPVESRAA